MWYLPYLEGLPPHPTPTSLPSELFTILQNLDQVSILSLESSLPPTPLQNKVDHSSVYTHAYYCIYHTVFYLLTSFLSPYVFPEWTKLSAWHIFEVQEIFVGKLCPKPVLVELFVFQTRLGLRGHSKAFCFIYCWGNQGPEKAVISPRSHCTFNGICPSLGKSLSLPNWGIQHFFSQEFSMFSYSILTQKFKAWTLKLDVLSLNSNYIVHYWETGT